MAPSRPRSTERRLLCSDEAADGRLRRAATPGFGCPTPGLRPSIASTLAGPAAVASGATSTTATDSSAQRMPSRQAGRGRNNPECPLSCVLAAALRQSAGPTEEGIDKHAENDSAPARRSDDDRGARRARRARLFAVFVAVTARRLPRKSRHPPRRAQPGGAGAGAQVAWTNRRAATRPRPASRGAQPPTKVEKKKEPEEKPEGARRRRAGQREKPDDAKFLAETNNRVEKKTISRHRTLNYFNARRADDHVKENETAKGPRRGRKPCSPATKARRRSQGAVRGQGKAMLENPSTNGATGWRSSSTPRRQPDNQEARTRSSATRTAAHPGRGEEARARRLAWQAGTRELRTLMPSAAVLDRIIGAPASDVSSRDDI